jgi:hypothetical protein
MSLLFWLLGLTAGYALTRKGQAWAAVLPAGIGLMIIDHYDPGSSTSARYIAVFLFFALLLIGRMAYLRYKVEWEAAGIVHTPNTGGEVGRVLVVAVVVLVLFAWTAPAMAATLPFASQFWVDATRPLDKLRTQFSNAFSSLRSSVGVVSDFYGSSMALGTGSHLGDDTVFIVVTDQKAPSGSRYYWRARTYDTYIDGTGPVQSAAAERSTRIISS